MMPPPGPPQPLIQEFFVGRIDYLEDVDITVTADPRMAFKLADWNLEFVFRPLDFIQVNAGLNGRMIQSALDLLDPQPQDRVLDLFCGLGNFTLPLARQVREAGITGE